MRSHNYERKILLNNFFLVHFFACPKKRTKERALRRNPYPYSLRKISGISELASLTQAEILI